jgi:hypothetical protein
VSFSQSDIISNKSVQDIDTLHEEASNKVLEWSDELDNSVSQWLLGDSSCASDDFTSYQSSNIDSFFQNKKYVSETDDIYVRLRVDNNLRTLSDNKIRFKLRAQIPFSKCKKQYKLFVDELSNKEDKSINANKDNGGHVGIRYVDEERLGIKSKYSIGFSGVNPFVRARYSMGFKLDEWDVESVQSFKYTAVKKYEEETDIYFDKTINNTELFRINLFRKSADELYGMDYSLSFEYFVNKNANSGFSASQTFRGNTKYSQTNRFNGIHNYITSFSWRENIWRKWFYYEVRPGVNFDRDYDYKANYSIRLFLDFYFGRMK